MAHDDHYHVHSHPGLPPPPVVGPPAPPPSNATIPLTVPQNTLAGPGVSRSFYSLERDLAQLRRDAGAKGILSANDVPAIETTKGPNPKPIWSLVIGGNLWPGPGPVPKVLVIGCHHAREWISVEVPYLIAEYLVDKYDPNPALPANETATPGTVNAQAQRIKHLVGNREIWFVPMLNAEGHDHTILASRKWRPNRFALVFRAATTIVAPQFGGGASRTISVPAGTSRFGVDINRNYHTADWGQETTGPGGLTTSRDPRDAGDDASFLGQIFCGLAPESEIETSAISGLIRGQKFKSVLSYHNFSEDILAADKTFGNNFTKSVGEGMKELITDRGGTYVFKSASGLYPTTGDTVDFYVEQSLVPGVPNTDRPAYTVELSPPNPPANRDHIFSGLPETEIRNVFRQNLASSLAVINCAGFNSAPTTTSTSFKLGIPPWIVTVVPNCWSRFKGWDPTI